MTNDRFQRQRDLVPGDQLAGLTITVIGVGAVGRQVAIQLAALGVRQMQLIDFDCVEFTNITTQGYWGSDLGQPKGTATANVLRRIDPDIRMEIIADRYRPRHHTGDVVFCCVDSISSRAAIWKALRTRCRFWCDGRMRGETIRILCAGDEAARTLYSRSLFPQAEAQTGPCTSRSTLFTASIAAGFMLHQFARWLRGIDPEPDLTLNLLASELVANDRVASIRGNHDC